MSAAETAPLAESLIAARENGSPNVVVEFQFTHSASSAFARCSVCAPELGERVQMEHHLAASARSRCCCCFCCRRGRTDRRLITANRPSVCARACDSKYKIFWHAIRQHSSARRTDASRREQPFASRIRQRRADRARDNRSKARKGWPFVCSSRFVGLFLRLRAPLLWRWVNKRPRNSPPALRQQQRAFVKDAPSASVSSARACN